MQTNAAVKGKQMQLMQPQFRLQCCYENLKSLYSTAVVIAATI